MFIRRAFDEFLHLQSDAEPTTFILDWVIDWRWFEEREAPDIMARQPSGTSASISAPASWPTH